MTIMRLFYKIPLNLFKPGLTKRPKELLLILNSVGQYDVCVLDMGISIAPYAALDCFFGRKGIN
jgi:hypothetical protein